MIIGMIAAISALFLGMFWGSVVISLIIPYIIMALVVLSVEKYYGQE
jgi:hypothetical protein